MGWKQPTKIQAGANPTPSKLPPSSAMAGLASLSTSAMASLGPPSTSSVHALAPLSTSPMAASAPPSAITMLVLCTVLKDQVQLPWWGLLFACGMTFVFTLPISIITTTTNQTPGLNVITEYAMGLIMPGYPIANVCFKVYGYMSMSQAVAFLSDFKLGHYMKIPLRSLFIVQFAGTLVAGAVNLSVAWFKLRFFGFALTECNRFAG